MDFSKLRATALQSGNDEEAVTVNTRALIDKVLARYSGEWTTLRELIQNAADAQASSVKIKFETFPSATVPLPSTTNPSEILKHVLLNHTLRRLVVINDGQVFGVNDWSRLKRIAEGNPDETKIGAFGVGFYSVFADCEEPFVSSGDQAMAFYWKGNSLFTRKAQLPPEQTSKETSFVLDYRNTTTPMPNLLSISQFLATSLTFVALQRLELWVDDSKIISLQKKVAPGVDVPLARGINMETKEGLMRIQSLERESVQMDATFMNVVGWKPSPLTSAPKMPGSFDGHYGNSSTDVSSLKSFFSRMTTRTEQEKLKTKAVREEKVLQDIVLEDVTATTTVSVFLRVTTATVKTSVNAQFAAELERATKKPPPKITRPAILTASYDESIATEENAVAKGVDVFASVLPGKQPGGRVFIGFPTHQTTGAGMHLSAPSVIPTVERESIDLNARWVRTWNQEMLRCAGIMARLAFMNEMQDLSEDLKQAAQRAGHGNKVTKSQIDQYIPRALHILNTFAFKDSTPSPNVRLLIEEAFWMAAKNPIIEVFSTRGVLTNTQVRLATEDLSGFVDGIPVVPEPLVGDLFMKKLIEYGLIVEITVSDVKKELSAKALNKDQLLQFIGWAGRKAITGDIDAPTIHSLMDVAVATTSNTEGSGEVIALGAITSYLDVKKIPAEVPIPTTCLPFEFTRGSQANELQALGWEALEIVPWLRFLIETNHNRSKSQDFTETVAFAASILQILSKAWDGLSPSSKATVVMLLKNVPIVPTKSGIKKPGEAYLANVKLFEDLPTVTSCPGVKEKFLVGIGLRKTVELEVIFARLLAPPAEKGGASEDNTTNTRFMDLLKYLASVKNDIPTEDLKKLKNAKFCPAEAGPKGMESSKRSARLYSVKELFEPKDALRNLQLPILHWPGPPGSYRASSPLGVFLSSLGLRQYPSVPELIDMMVAESHNAFPNEPMNYFIAHHQNNGYFQFSIGESDKKFLPLENGLAPTLEVVSPAECFTNQDCQILGFKILKKELHMHANKFGIARDPPILDCVNRLVANPPTDRPSATKVFEYFSSRINELGQNSIARLHEARIIPVVTKQHGVQDASSEKVLEQNSLRLLPPESCYIGSSTTYGDIFAFVDFGSSANAFLFKCGSKTEPTIRELAVHASTQPARLYGVLQSPDKYLNLLRKLAAESVQLKRDKELWKLMKSSKFLLGEAEISANDSKKKRASLKPGDDQFDSDLEDDDVAPIKEYKLAKPSDIVIIDDYVSYRLFKSSLMTAPEDVEIENFYRSLGSVDLGNLVEMSLRLGSASEKQLSAANMRAHVLERAKLFLHEVKREDIKHDGRWLEKNLTVQVVSSIELRRSLRGHAVSHREKRTAAMNERGCALYITGGNASAYQIASSICKVLLERQSQSLMITFEQFLTLSLIDLRNRGYNVDRILRAKAAERRFAEEERQKQLAIEQDQIRQQEKSWSRKTVEPPVEREPPMPGSFGVDSPENSPAPQGKKGFFNMFKRNSDIKGSSSGSSSQEHDEQSNGLVKHKRPETPKAGETERVTSPAEVQQNLSSAIQASRAHDSDHLFSKPTTTTVKEQQTYCDSTTAHNLVYLAEASNGTRLFITKGQISPQQFLRDNVSSLNAFAVLLHEICDVYNLPHSAMHIFYEPSGSTIAFNRDGSIFCNYRYFLQLHKDELAAKREVAGSYWWVVVAHELAHNLVSAHDSKHSFYTENLIANYYTRMNAKTTAWIAAREQPLLEFE
ncbi:related to NUO-14 NADH2 dehydrogenase (ubiquinone) 14K chain [Phialocephala subalpina]|uniref:Related to NUO-14 NADH2 dehydrogenase (Ubiquinone) 14K chain n=1 Tax=Phialocephala subalpina TaxID=576137 RepID=A0A1L7X4Z6_9HELO|nr:related to NUO-14 NADH2 dehydrogenase (ubiquinone) 14K chain [Phialocephala subalpina]